jgi:hypothetical protein
MVSGAAAHFIAGRGEQSPTAVAVEFQHQLMEEVRVGR